MTRCALGLTQRVFVAPGSGEKRDCLAQDWTAFMAALGVRWIALPNQPAVAVDLAREFGLSGIILTGGDDIGVFPERDATEAALIEWCLASAHPLMGVCRGFQFMHHYFGGELVRAAPDVHVAKRHIVCMANGEQREVNSFHNFSPDFSTLPSGYPLAELARSADGMVEAAGDGGGLLGLMWHPEREPEPGAADAELFRRHFTI